MRRRGRMESCHPRELICWVSQLLSELLDESADSMAANCWTSWFSWSVRAACIEVICWPRLLTWLVLPSIRELIVPPASASWPTSVEKLLAHPPSNCCTASELAEIALASVVVFRVRSPASAEADSVPEPVVAPVLTPMSSIVLRDPPLTPEIVAYIAERICM